MELVAVIKSINFVAANYPGANMSIYTDSQYVVKLPDRMEKLVNNQYITKKGEVLNNSDLLQILISLVQNHSITFYKVKAHQTNGTENLNREADMICRRLMRENSKRT